jgi:hypothetical protein
MKRRSKVWLLWDASVLAKLIVGNARMQSKIYRVLGPDQQKKLSDFEQSQDTATMRLG